MKNKSTLMLLELVIMLLVFLLAAALCLRAFVWADIRSAEGKNEDMALLQAQNAAEAIKASGGDFAAAAKLLGGQWNGRTLQLDFDENWKTTVQNGVFLLQAGMTENDTNYLGSGSVKILDQRGNPLAQLDICWQEVTP